MKLVLISISDIKDWRFKPDDQSDIVAQARTAYPDAVLCANYNFTYLVGSGDHGVSSSRWRRETHSTEAVEALYVMPASLIAQQANIMDMMGEFPGDYPVRIHVEGNKQVAAKYFSAEFTAAEFARMEIV